MCLKLKYKVWVGCEFRVASKETKDLYFLPVYHSSRLVAYFNLNRRFTKSTCDFETTPSIDNARLRFFDFLVRMWRLKDFWCVIFPVAVTLKRFLALEFVLTFGIWNAISGKPLRRFCTGKTLGGPLQAITKLNQNQVWGRKDRDEIAKKGNGGFFNC